MPGSAFRSVASSPITEGVIGLLTSEPPVDGSASRQKFTKPYTPRTNGKAERFIQTAMREWAYAYAYQNSAQRLSELPYWIHLYNWHRPHSSLDRQAPISRLGRKRNNLLRLHS